MSIEKKRVHRKRDMREQDQVFVEIEGRGQIGPELAVEAKADEIRTLVSAIARGEVGADRGFDEKDFT